MPNLKKACVLILLALWSIMLNDPPSAFSQGKEFLRLRSTPEGTPTSYDTAKAKGSFAEYFMSAGDKIEIYVWQNPDLTREVTIRSDGKLSYPLIGTFKASGLSLDQLQEEIRTRLAKYIRSPEVTVSVIEAVGNKIIVLGQVNYPGIYTFSGNIDIIEAIAMAGDFTPDGRRESIMIISDNFTENPKVRRLNALSALRNGMRTEESVLKPNDVVYVPRSTIADFNKFLNEVQPTINTLSNFFTAGTNASSFFKEGRAWFLHRDVKIIRGD